MNLNFGKIGRVGLVAGFLMFLNLPAGQATEVQTEGAKAIIAGIQFEGDSGGAGNSFNGLTFTFGMPIAGGYYSDIKNDKFYEKCCWYWHTDPKGRTTGRYVFGVNGVTVTITNTSENVKTIVWKDSGIFAGTFSGRPATDRTEIENFENPYRTPNTVLPPKATVQMKIYLGRSYRMRGFWLPAYAYIRQGKEKPINIRMNLYVINGPDLQAKGSFIKVNTPSVILPEALVGQYAKAETPQQK